ncbi:MAG: DUF1566 domain-containing protein [Thermodesulfobacteriota bacterium]
MRRRYRLALACTVVLSLPVLCRPGILTGAPVPDASNFSYTKLDAGGQELPPSATPGEGWRMTRDNVTGLIWEIKQAADGTPNYTNPSDADNIYAWCSSDPAHASRPGVCEGNHTQQFLDALNGAGFGGFADWRLPGREELRSIVDYRRSRPAVDPVFFAGTDSSPYWSGDLYASTPFPWVLDFSEGGDNETHYPAEAMHVMAVRGQRQGSTYVDNRNGTVSDAAHRLMWQKNVAQTTFSQPTAMLEAQSLTLAGHSDWRLPTVKEMTSLVDLGRINPAINADLFPATPTSRTFWTGTATVDPTNSDGFWRVNFYTGSTNDYGVGRGKIDNGERYVRLVRSCGAEGNPCTSIPGDCNGDAVVDLRDAILTLQAASGMLAGGLLNAVPATGQPTLGVSDAVYILRTIAEQN